MKLSRLFPTLVAVVALATVAAADDVTVHLTKDQALAFVFPEADEVLELRHILSSHEIGRIQDRAGRSVEEGGFFIYIARADDAIAGYAVVVAEIGKVMPITHIVGVSPDGEVGEVAVMIYRESHGGEVAQRRFMEQYRGTELGDTIRVGKDIINISGATLSAQAICRGVRKALAVVETVIGDRDADAVTELLEDAKDVTPSSLADGSDPAAPERLGRGHLRSQRRIMGTVCSVEAFGDDETALAAALDAALDEVQRWDDVLSNWRDDTPLARFNVAAADVDVPLGPALADWLADAATWCDLTGGAFDPTLGALSDAWGLRTGTPARPATGRLTAARGASGWSRLSFDPVRHTARRLHDALALDPGASGKGFALDRAADVLRQHGVSRALLSFRSTLLALDAPPNSDGWLVPIVHDGNGRIVQTIVLVDDALSVSSGSLRAFDDAGVARGHVIDPETGVPVAAHRLAWARHRSAAGSDALATALLVRGPALAPVGGATGAFLGDANAGVAEWPAQP